jgi:hypothetical protein
VDLLVEVARGEERGDNGVARAGRGAGPLEDLDGDEAPLLQRLEFGLFVEHVRLEEAQALLRGVDDGAPTLAAEVERARLARLQDRLQDVAESQLS